MLTARETVRALKEYHPPLSGRAGLRADFNENTIGCSPRVLAKLQTVLAEQLAIYPEREPVERIVAGFFGRAPEEVLLTNGVDEGIHLLCETYLEAGDEALIVVPTFSMYEIYALQTGARAVAVQADREREFAFPVEQVLAAITPDTKMITIANPNNPTGQVVAQKDLIRIVEAAPRAAVLVDEAYYEFFGESLMPRVGEWTNLFVARTFSKAYGLAGLRCGVLAGASKAMRMVRKVCSPYNVNGIALACLPEALADTEYAQGYAAQIRRGREALSSELRGLGLRTWPSQANFVLAEFGGARVAFVQGMRRRGILVRDRHGDPGCAGCVRITVPTAEQLPLLLAALREVCAEALPKAVTR